MLRHAPGVTSCRGFASEPHRLQDCAAKRLNSTVTWELPIPIRRLALPTARGGSRLANQYGGKGLRRGSLAALGDVRFPNRIRVTRTEMLIGGARGLFHRGGDLEILFDVLKISLPLKRTAQLSIVDHGARAQETLKRDYPPPVTRYSHAAESHEPRASAR